MTRRSKREMEKFDKEEQRRNLRPAYEREAVGAGFVSFKDLLNIKGDYSNVPIEILNLKIHTYNTLKRYHINSLEECLNYSKSELLEMKNLGKKRLDDLSSEILRWMSANK